MLPALVSSILTHSLSAAGACIAALFFSLSSKSLWGFPECLPYLCVHCQCQEILLATFCGPAETTHISTYCSQKLVPLTKLRKLTSFSCTWVSAVRHNTFGRRFVLSLLTQSLLFHKSHHHNIHSQIRMLRLLMPTEFPLWGCLYGLVCQAFPSVILACASSTNFEPHISIFYCG